MCRTQLNDPTSITAPLTDDAEVFLSSTSPFFMFPVSLFFSFCVRDVCCISLHNSLSPRAKKKCSLLNFSFYCNYTSIFFFAVLRLPLFSFRKLDFFLELTILPTIGVSSACSFQSYLLSLDSPPRILKESTDAKLEHADTFGFFNEDETPVSAIKNGEVGAMISATS